MFEKNMKIAYLFDLYGDALDEHTSSVMRSYYNDDLSLSEIASEVGISRQGVRHLIKKGEEQLFFYEEKFRLSEKERELEGVCDLLSEIANELSKKGLFDEAERISDIAQIISKGSTDVSEPN